jgi:hypothetical protein
MMENTQKKKLDKMGRKRMIPKMGRKRYGELEEE